MKTKVYSIQLGRIESEHPESEINNVDKLIVLGESVNDACVKVDLEDGEFIESCELISIVDLE